MQGEPSRMCGNHRLRSMDRSLLVASPMASRVILKVLSAFVLCCAQPAPAPDVTAQPSPAPESHEAVEVSPPATPSALVEEARAVVQHKTAVRWTTVASLLVDGTESSHPNRTNSRGW